MTRHYNPSITERANRILATKSGDFLSDEVISNIQPVIAIAPVAGIIKSGASGTIFTTPADKDFYLTGLSASFSKAAGDTGTSLTLTGFVDGVSVPLIRLAGVTLTVERDSVVADFTYPIKIDRNTAIASGASGTFTASAFCIRGYTEEVTR